jgi:hypothetical protein
MLAGRNSIFMVMPFVAVSIRGIDILLFEKPRTSGCLAGRPSQTARGAALQLRFRKQVGELFWVRHRRFAGEIFTHVGSRFTFER